MVGSLIMAVGLMGQAPAARAEVIGREAVPIAGQVAGAVAAAESDRGRLIARRRAKKSAAYAGRLDREYREAVAAEKAAETAKREYKEMLPAMLENQRQMLQRQTDLERNQVLNRLAGAAERSAGYVYPGQSPTMGPYR
jgi:hypothetical protein